ncbi:HD-GYP domain-containing protein [Kribbella sp. DT2]|uniref:HD-GYP domain-containing protein n=1 Tax=Kribbella sp. DT2 TaxID=3393427 RepID=UPI003CF5A149
MLRLFVSVTVLCAVIVFVVSLTHVTDVVTILLLCAFMLVGGSLRSRLDQQNRASLDTVILVAVYPLAGPAAAVVVSACNALVQRRGIPLMKRAFNGSQFVLSAAVGGVVYDLTGGPVGAEVLVVPHQLVFTGVLACLGTLVVNALLMSTVLLLDQGVSPLRSMRYAAAPTLTPLLGYGCLGLLLAVVWIGGLGFVAGLLILVPLLVARWALRQYEAEKTAQAATMRAFIHLIETKDPYTRGHSERVSKGVGMLGRFLKLNPDRQIALEHAGLLHDVGKVGVPTSIIRKPGRLDDTEMDAIRLHPARGVELIGNIPFLEEVKSAVLHHHEKYDGTGYPAGLSATNIPYFARIIGIVDAFDCLTSNRSYRPARSVEETLAILEQDKLTHFDPRLVDSFVSVIRQHGWKAAAVDQPAPDGSVEASIDHDDLSLGSSGGASGSAAGPA